MDFSNWELALLSGFGAVIGAVIGDKLKLRERIHLRLGVKTRLHRILYSIVVMVVIFGMAGISIKLLLELFSQNRIVVHIAGALVGGIAGGFAASLLLKRG